MRELTQAEELDLSVEWQNVKEFAKGREPSAWALAVIEAEKIFRETLSSLSSGEDLKTKLKNARAVFGQLEALLAARELHRRIVFEVGFLPTREEVNQALESYFQAILDLTSFDRPLLSFGERFRHAFSLRFGRFLRYLRAALICLVFFFFLVWFLADTAYGQKLVNFLLDLTHWVLARIGFLILGLAGVLLLILLSFFYFERRRD